MDESTAIDRGERCLPSSSGNQAESCKSINHRMRPQYVCGVSTRAFGAVCLERLSDQTPSGEAHSPRACSPDPSTKPLGKGEGSQETREEPTDIEVGIFLCRVYAVAELEEQRPVAGESIHELSPETSLYRSQPPAPLACHPANLNGGRERTLGHTGLPVKFLSDVRQPNGLAVEALVCRDWAPPCRRHEQPRVMRDLQVEGGNQSSSQVPWYIHRNTAAGLSSDLASDLGVHLYGNAPPRG